MRYKRLLRYGVMLLVCVALLVLGVGRATNVITDQVRTDLEAQLGDITQRTLIIVNQNLETDIHDLTSLAAAVSTLGGPSAPEAQTFAMSDEWKKAGARLTISDAQGNSRSNDGLEGNVADSPLFQQAMTGETVVSSMQSDLLGTQDSKAVLVLVPVMQNGQAVGIITSTRDVQFYQNLIQFPLYQDNGTSYLVGKDGKIIASHETEENSFEAVLENMMESNGGQETDPGLTQMLQGMQEGESSSIEIAQGNEKSYISYAPVETSGWYLVNRVSGAQLKTQIQVLRQGAFTVATIAVILFFVLLAVLFITDERKAKLMERMAMYDQLTGLPNWQYLQKYYGELHNREEWVFLLFRIPDFRRVSTVFGYPVAAKMLKDIAAEFKSNMEEKELAAHVSEDCFALFLKGKEGSTVTENRINKLFQRLEHIPITGDSIVYDYHCSFVGGAYQIEGVDDEFAIVNRRANAVIEAHATDKRVAWSWFDKEMNGKISLQDTLMPEMFRALQNEEFIPYFQPQHQVNTKEIVGAEVLARWKHPTHGILLPGLFVPLLEASGCVLELDLIMLEQACKMIQNWLDKGLLPVPLSVNISRLNLHRRDFLERLLGIVHKYSTPTSLISLELTETAIFDNVEKVLELTRRMEAEGFILSMDDFGTGYSSLNMLSEIPVDVVKLDQTFLQHIESGKRGRLVLEHVVAMAKALHIELVAEGVETAEQVEVVKEIGCSVVQGFFFSRPMPPEDFERLIFPELSAPEA